MEIDEHILPTPLTGDGFVTPTADNDNWGVTSTMTPAEAIQLFRSWKREIWCELAANPQLWQCPEHRRKRDVTYAIDKCARWQFYKGR